MNLSSRGVSPEEDGMKGNCPNRIPLLVRVLLLRFSKMSAQLFSSTVWMKINDDVGGHDSFVFDYHVLETYCADTAVGENQSPPYPPDGFAAVFMGIASREK